MRLSVISALALLAACGAFQQPPPVAEAPVESAPREVSTIVVPIHSTLAPLLPIIESQVLKSVESKGYEHLPKDPYAVRYKVARDPIALFRDASGLHATTTVHYSLEGCRITQKPFSNETTLFPCVSCGFDEPMRDATIALDAQLEWDENWRLRTRTRPRPIAFGRRCTVTFMNLDITDWKLAPIVNEQLQQAAKTIDANTPKLTSIRPGAAQIWSSLQTPAEIAPGTRPGGGACREPAADAGGKRPAHVAGDGAARHRARADLRRRPARVERAVAAHADARGCR